jgi:hypothetical protein
MSKVVTQKPNSALERTVEFRGRPLVANKVLAGSACGKPHCGRPLTSLVR